MVFDLILAALALVTLWHFIQMVFWFVLWLTIQPVRLATWLITAMLPERRASAQQPNVIPFRRSAWR